jgi:hypothetical protein
VRLLTREISLRAAAVVVAAALLVSFLAGREKPAETVMAAHAAVVAKPYANEEEHELSLDKLRRALPEPGKVDPFAPRSFTPPQPRLADAPPARPSAPPLPFTYLGKVIDNGQTSVFVARGDENYSLEAGQTIAGSYRVDKITDTAVTFTYLPMKTRQTLAIPRTE